jgi:hypothetical protein
VNIISHLLATSTGTIFSGYVIGTSITVSLLALCFYFVFRKDFLLTFSLLHLSSFAVILSINQDPRELIDLNGHPILFPAIHLITALMTALYYRLVIQLLQVQHRKTLAINALWILVVLVVIVRVVVAATYSLTFIQVASLVNTLIFLGSAYIGLRWQTKNGAEQLSKYSLIVISVFSLYSMARSGILPASAFDQQIANVIVLGHALTSVIWLFANIEIARSSYEERKMRELKRRARAFIEIRDMINTPLQILELSVDVLDQYSETEVTQRMRKAIQKLAEINKLLKPFERDVDWNRDDTFFNTKDVISIRSG